jgi:MraZ protein
MRYFVSNAQNKIDGKSRVSIPAPFRKSLEQEPNPGIALVPGLSRQPAIEAMGLTEYMKIVERVEQEPPYAARTRALRRIVITNAQIVQMDEYGRIVLTEPMRRFIGLEGEEVFFAGNGRTFQLWNPATYADAQQELDELGDEALETFNWGGVA